MCIETIEIEGVGSPRDAYEVSEFLKGLPAIDDARCDLLTGTLTIDYDESEINRESVLDEVERAGCIPCERQSNSVLARLKRSAGI